MKGSIKIIVLALICLFTVTVMAGVAQATSGPTPDAKAAQVITTDTSHSEIKITEFAPGQTVYVVYLIQADKYADIVVVDDNDVEVPGTAHPAAHDSGEFGFVPPQPGTYYVLVNGYKDEQIAVASFFVLPEVLGAISVLGAGIAAFGIVKFKNRSAKS